MTAKKSIGNASNDRCENNEGRIDSWVFIPRFGRINWGYFFSELVLFWKSYGCGDRILCCDLNRKHNIPFFSLVIDFCLSRLNKLSNLP